MYFKKKIFFKLKETGKINFNNIFCLTQYMQNIIIPTCNQYKNYWDILYFFFCARSSWSGMNFTYKTYVYLD